MATKNAYDDGQFSWVDLMAHDMKAAEQFYGAVFGWSCEHQDTQGGPPYGMFGLEGSPVGGIGEMNEAMKQQGVPPMWNSYINVGDIEATVKKAQKLGAELTVPVMKVLDAGWLAFLKDPTGGHVGLWQPGTHCGAVTVNEPGSLCWNELATRDIEKAREFFGALFGWKFAEHDAPTAYYIIQSGDRPNGGLMQMDEQWGDAPPHWMVYFAVADTDRTAASIERHGGKICVPGFDTPVGRVAVVGDPQGATFSLIQLAQPPA